MKKKKTSFTIALKLLAVCILLLSCNKEKNEPALVLNQSTLISHRGDQFLFEIKKGNEIIPSTEFEWNLDNEYLGAVANGWFYAERIGTGKITAIRNGETFVADVRVEPRFNFLTSDLVIDFDFSFEVIKGLEKRELISEIAPEKLIYKGDTDNVKSIVYYFSSGRLYSVEVEFSDETPWNDLLFYYSERNHSGGGNSGIGNGGVHQFSPIDRRYRILLHEQPNIASYLESRN